jgi:hypothetical protein
VISDVSPWLLTLTSIQVQPGGQAEFMISYDNTAATPQTLTCSGVSGADPTLTLSNGQTEHAVTDYCAQHSSESVISVAGGQALQSYVVFPDASKLGQPFTFDWPAEDLSGGISGLQLPTSG